MQSKSSALRVNTLFSKEEQAFQVEVREFLQDYRDLDGFYCQGHKWPEVRAMFSAMAEKNWLALSWPKKFGGLARGPVYEFILWDEVAYARAARNPLAAGIVAQTLIRYGTSVQQDIWLPRIRAGDIHFSLCYSEPEAGSDLASLRLRAEKSRRRKSLHAQWSKVLAVLCPGHGLSLGTGAQWYTGKPRARSQLVYL